MKQPLDTYALENYSPTDTSNGRFYRLSHGF